MNPNLTTSEQRRFRRKILKRMILYSLLAALTSWGFAQLALFWMPVLGYPREWVGYIAVALVVLVPAAGSVASFGMWWWEPYPLTRFWNSARRLFTRRRARA